MDFMPWHKMALFVALGRRRKMKQAEKNTGF